MFSDYEKNQVSVFKNQAYSFCWIALEIDQSNQIVLNFLKISITYGTKKQIRHYKLINSN